jgi:ubiquinone/menaquinone biosynthesis C-methylase UbiE
MGLYNDRFLPRFIDLTLGKPMDGVRARVSSGLEGEVLEVGFGSGRNVPHYPKSVTRVLAVDPATYGRKLAATRLAASPVPIEFVGLDGQDLRLPDESVDHVLVTWTLCTIPDIEQALTEMRRVLRPGGSVHFVEHGRSPRASVAAWQDRLTPVWGKLFGGCHLNRSFPDLLEGAGLSVEQLQCYRAKGPELASYFYEGTATKP